MYSASALRSQCSGDLRDVHLAQVYLHDPSLAVSLTDEEDPPRMFSVLHKPQTTVWGFFNSFNYVRCETKPDDSISDSDSTPRLEGVEGLWAGSVSKT